MHSIQKRALLTVLVSGVLLLLTGCGGGPAAPPAGDELAAFKQRAAEAGCADLVNHLYQIDGRLVFWQIEGNCADAAYSRTLFGSTVDEVLCQLHDSIAGPVDDCQDEAYREMFDTIIANLDKPDLGLGAEHTVAEIPF